MKQISYRERDFAFGQIILTMRSQIGLTQTALADYLGISRRAVGDWEAGNKYPKPQNLKQLIELALANRVFEVNNEADQIRALWRASRTRVLLDEKWLANLLAAQTADPQKLPPPRRPGLTPAELNTVITPLNERIDWDFTTEAAQDWGEAPSIHNFFGREPELKILTSWLMDKSCRIINLLGLGGIGKTTLAIRLGQQLAGSFNYVVWRSLASGLPLDQFLPSILHFLSGQLSLPLPPDSTDSISLLIRLLQQHRCLLILDNLETLMEEATESGHYREGYADYAVLFRRLAETNHQSCVLLTSREKPRELVPFEGSKSPVRTLRLAGLSQAEFQKILADQDLTGNTEDWAELTAHYGGNPLALKLVCETIREIFHTNIRSFLANNTFIFGDISYLLDSQFNRLNRLEQDLMIWLAIEREPVGLRDLEKDMGFQETDRPGLLEALQSLRRRALVENKDGEGEFSLQSVVMEYVTQRLIQKVTGEILKAGSAAQTGFAYPYLAKFALMKAHSKAYIWQTQQRVIIGPLLNKLKNPPAQSASFEYQLGLIIKDLQKWPGQQQGYAGGNLLNLLVAAGADLQGWDFAGLNLWEANLAGVELQNVNLAGCDLSRTVFTEGFSYILSLAYQPFGNSLAGGELDGKLKVWQTPDPAQSAGYTVSLECQAHPEAVSALAYSPDGQWIATGSYDRTVKLWHARTLENTRVGLGHTEAVRSLVFSPNGQFLASGSLDGTIKVWQVPTGVLLGTINTRTGWVWALAFSPNSRLLASGSFENTISLWQIEPEVWAEPQPLATVGAHRGGVFALTFSSDGRTLYSGGADQLIRGWSTQTLQLVQVLRGHSGAVQALALSPDGRSLASGSSDRTVRLWQPTTQDTSLMTLVGHNAPVVSVAFNPAGKVLASTSSDRSIRLWSARRGENLTVFQGYVRTMASLSVSPDEQYLAATANNQVLLWQLSRYEEHQPSPGVPSLVLRGHPNLVKAVVFSPAGKLLASADQDGFIRLWDINKRASGGQGPPEQIFGPGAPFEIVNRLVFSPDGTRLASGIHTGAIQLWSVATGQPLTRLDGTDIVWALAFSPDGTLASGGNDGQLRLWDSQNYTLKTLAGNSTRPIAALAYHPAGNFLACARFDASIEVWQLQLDNSWQELLLPALHQGAVESVAFQPDPAKSILLSGGGDGTVRLWDVFQRKELTRFVHGQFVSSVAFTAGGKQVLSAGEGGLIKLWDIDSGHLLATYRDLLPYEGVNIRGAVGLSSLRQTNLVGLGAIDQP